MSPFAYWFEASRADHESAGHARVAPSPSRQSVLRAMVSRELHLMHGRDVLGVDLDL